MLRLDKIFFDAITADAELMAICGYEAPSEDYPQGKPARIKSTCFEVSPDETDKTPLPYILILDEGKQPAQTTKDDEWMPSQWRVGAGVEVGATSPNEVDAIIMKAMRVIANYIQMDPILNVADPFSPAFNSSSVWGPLMGRKFYIGARFNLY